MDRGCGMRFSGFPPSELAGVVEFVHRCRHRRGRAFRITVSRRQSGKNAPPHPRSVRSFGSVNAPCRWSHCQRACYWHRTCWQKARNATEPRDDAAMPPKSRMTGGMGRVLFDSGRLTGILRAPPSPMSTLPNGVEVRGKFTRPGIEKTRSIPAVNLQRRASDSPAFAGPRCAAPAGAGGSLGPLAAICEQRSSR